MTTKLYKQNKITQKNSSRVELCKKKKKKAMKQEGKQLGLTKVSEV